jgi:uncharacterized membrane protein (UPF0182 family)
VECRTPLLHDRLPPSIDDPTRRPRRGRLGIYLLLLVFGLWATASSAVSYYVDALWFGSLGYEAVFWKSLNLQSLVFVLFAGSTFLVLYGAFLGLKPARFGERGIGNVIIINGQPLSLPVGPVLRLLASVIAVIAALVAGVVMMNDWSVFALWWYGGRAATSLAGGATDPIFGRPIAFYLFTLPVWDLVAAWLMTLAVMTCAIAVFFAVVGGGLVRGRPAGRAVPPLRGVALAWAAALLVMAARTYIGRFDRLFDDHTIFAGVTYTEAHVTLTGLLIVSILLALGAVMAAVSAFAAPRVRWLVGAAMPALVAFIATGGIGAYVNGFIVKPNELVRERPYIAHNIEMTRQAFGLNRISRRAFPAETTVEAADPSNNRATLQNIRLWDWRALQDTLRQLQEIRTYYDFPDIDIDRYTIDGTLRQVMLATRELNVEKLPQSSRNWINEKLIYTHGYGITMNPVNGFTPEGLPTLILKDMPVQTSVPGLTVTRPEVYFGEMTNTDVYVKTRQQEFNYPQGQTNSLTSYQGTGGIGLGGVARRLLIAFDRGDLGTLPFSDDVTSDSRLLMRRNVRARVAALAPFLTFEPDPYIVLRDDGRLSWIIDAFTTSDRYPYSRPYSFANARINYVRNSVKVVIDAYDGSTTFYVFDQTDPLVAAYRTMFPALFKDASAMAPDLRRHVRYPELLLDVQAEVYGLYHMTDPAVFYNREDLWAVASDVVAVDRGERATQPMEPNFVLMKLPDEAGIEFVEILPFTPANRNNLIGWIAGRSDASHYGDAIVYDFPRTRLVDGPLQIEARIDQNAQLSGQLSLWNQQGSHVRRGALLVIPIGRALLYAEAIYLQAERSPMPELRLVVLALQDRLVYAPTFEAALANLFGGAGSAAAMTPATPAPAAAAGRGPATGPDAAAPDIDTIIAEATRAFADYQRLTAEGKLGEAGQKLDQLKRALEELGKRRR